MGGSGWLVNVLDDMCVALMKLEEAEDTNTDSRGVNAARVIEQWFEDREGRIMLVRLEKEGFWLRTPIGVTSAVPFGHLTALARERLAKCHAIDREIQEARAERKAKAKVKVHRGPR